MSEENGETAQATVEVNPELKDLFQEEYRFELKDELGLENIMAVPELDKVTVNMGVGKHEEQRDRVNAAKNDLARITSQEPVVTRAKKAIAAFDIRKGDPIGVKVTLRGDRMYAFVERLIKIVIPRIKDFRGLEPDAMDGQGNFSMGITDQATFPGIEIDEVDYPHGMDITITTTAENNREGLALLRKLGMPFKEV